MHGLTPEELAALERLRAWIRDYGHEKQPQFIADLQALLRLVPADEGEAIDKPWLLKIGGTAEGNPLKVLFERPEEMPIGLWDIGDNGWKAVLWLGSNHSVTIVRGLKTRGDFRRLAAALGIQATTGGGE